MAAQYQEIQELLRSRADLNVRLSLMPYDGTPEIKERGDGKYLYVRKRVAGKQTSTYVGVYTEELYNLLLRNAREAREIRKELRSIEKQLAAAGYSEDELSADVLNNIAFARANMKMNIYDQAVLEGVATSFPQTEEIIENGKVFGMTATDVQKILNLKHAWEFILDRNVVASRSDYYMLSHIARLVNEGFFAEGGRIRGVPVIIGGSSYVPPLSNELDVKEKLREITEETDEAINIAIKLCLYCMKTQIFLDGNKRASVIFANHYLIAHGGGFLVIPEKEVPEFKKLLVKYYEGEDISIITTFMKERCWKTMQNVIDIAERTIIMERTEPLAYGSLIKKLDHNKSKWKIPVQICDESIQQYFQGAASEDYASHLQTYLLQKLGEGRYESEDAAVFDGHSDIGVTMNTYTHLGLDDAKNEMIRMEELEQARKEVDKAEGKKPMKQNMFKVV